MTHPNPVPPTNVDADNPYIGLDRGLFLSRETGTVQYLRVSKARWVSKGPTGALSRLEFQLMRYPTQPMTSVELKSGELLSTPSGGYWFDAHTRGRMDSPILAEYWAVDSYYRHYSLAGALLTSDEKTRVFEQAQQLVEVMGSFVGLKAIEYSVDFDTLEGPLEKTGSRLVIDYRVGEEDRTMIVENPDVGDDPVVFAIHRIRAAKGN